MSKTMAEIDFAMVTTRTDGGQLATRQMSNNGEVEYDGDSFYFSWDSAGPVNDIGRASGRLVVQGSAGLLGKPPMFIAVEGTARIVLSPFLWMAMRHALDSGSPGARRARRDFATQP